MTEEEAIKRIIDAVRFAGDWALDHAPAHYDCEQRITLAMHVLLSSLDGVADGPPVDMVVLLCDSETGEPYDEVRVSTMLHEYLYEEGRTDRWARTTSRQT